MARKYFVDWSDPECPLIRPDHYLNELDATVQSFADCKREIIAHYRKQIEDLNQQISNYKVQVGDLKQQIGYVRSLKSSDMTISKERFYARWNNS